MAANLMFEVAHTLTLIFTAMGMLIFLLLFFLGENLKHALPYALDFWMAAGLLKLSDNPKWNVILTVGMIVILRKVLTLRSGASDLQPARCSR